MPALKKAVSEKSLELNVCAELLQCIRLWPNCSRALWFGLTQSQEHRMGLDEFVLNVPSNLLLMLQFKAPRASAWGGGSYTFDLNVRQHQTLLTLAVNFPKNVFYVFPLYRDWGKAGRHAPSLSKDTWLMPVGSMPLSLQSLQPTSPRVSCRVDISRAGSNIDVWCRSENALAKAMSVAELCSLGQVPTISAAQLEEWVEGLDHVSPGSASLGRPFGRLSALFVP